MAQSHHILHVNVSHQGKLAKFFPYENHTFHQSIHQMAQQIFHIHSSCTPQINELPFGAAL